VKVGLRADTPTWYLPLQYATGKWRSMEGRNLALLLLFRLTKICEVVILVARFLHTGDSDFSHHPSFFRNWAYMVATSGRQVRLDNGVV
jgi:hypothetical protein